MIGKEKFFRDECIERKELIEDFEVMGGAFLETKAFVS